MTGVSTIQVESKSRTSAETEASHFVSTGINEKEVTLGLLHNITPQIVSSTKKLSQAMKGIEKNVQNIKLATADPHLAASSQCLMPATQVSVQIGKVRKAFGSIALAVSKGAQMVHASHCRCLPFDGCVLPGETGKALA